MTPAPEPAPPPTFREVGYVATVLGLILDQVNKLHMLFIVNIIAVQPIELTPFFELVMVWNRGISYGLFQQGGDIGRYILIAISLVTTVALLIWIWRADRRWVALAAGLIAGGAIGNTIDRIAYGAVADFYHFHVGSFSWYVFNLADVWIVAGVAILIVDQLFGNHSQQSGHNSKG